MEIIAKVLLFIAKFALLLLGLIMVGGGGVASFCGIVLKSDGMVAGGMLVIVLGLVLFIKLLRHFMQLIDSSDNEAAEAPKALEWESDRDSRS